MEKTYYKDAKKFCEENFAFDFFPTVCSILSQQEKSILSPEKVTQKLNWITIKARKKNAEKEILALKEVEKIIEKAREIVVKNKLTITTKYSNSHKTMHASYAVGTKTFCYEKRQGNFKGSIPGTFEIDEKYLMKEGPAFYNSYISFFEKVKVALSAENVDELRHIFSCQPENIVFFSNEYHRM